MLNPNIFYDHDASVLGSTSGPISGPLSVNVRPTSDSIFIGENLTFYVMEFPSTLMQCICTICRGGLDGYSLSIVSFPILPFPNKYSSLNV